MAENLNYNASGSKCGSVLTGSGTVGDANTATCDKYGRLYDWATAVNLASSCNSTTCASQITAKHRGICPSGWHLPSNAEWTTLTDLVGGGSTAGTKLKATTDDWNSYSGVPAGTDAYGFSALPGGLGYSRGDFLDVGYYGLWWSATETEENAFNAYNRFIGHDWEGADLDGADKSFNLLSVRCLQDY